MERVCVCTGWSNKTETLDVISAIYHCCLSEWCFIQISLVFWAVPFLGGERARERVTNISLLCRAHAHTHTVNRGTKSDELYRFVGCLFLIKCDIFECFFCDWMDPMPFHSLSSHSIFLIVSLHCAFRLCAKRTFVIIYIQTWKNRERNCINTMATCHV